MSNPASDTRRSSRQRAMSSTKTPSKRKRAKHGKDRCPVRPLAPASFEAIQIPETSAYRVDTTGLDHSQADRVFQRQQPIRKVKVLQSIEHQIDPHNPEHTPYPWDDPIMFDANVFGPPSQTKNRKEKEATPAHEVDAPFSPGNTTSVSDLVISPLQQKRKRRYRSNRGGAVPQITGSQHCANAAANRSFTCARVKRELTAALDLTSCQVYSNQPIKKGDDILPGSLSEFHTAKAQTMQKQMDQLAGLLKEERLVADSTRRERDLWYQRARDLLERILPAQPTSTPRQQGLTIQDQHNNNTARTGIIPQGCAIPSTLAPDLLRDTLKNHNQNERIRSPTRATKDQGKGEQSSQDLSTGKDQLQSQGNGSRVEGNETEALQRPILSTAEADPSTSTCRKGVGESEDRNGRTKLVSRELSELPELETLLRENPRPRTQIHDPRHIYNPSSTRPTTQINMPFRPFSEGTSTSKAPPAISATEEQLYKGNAHTDGLGLEADKVPPVSDKQGSSTQKTTTFTNLDNREIPTGPRYPTIRPLRDTGMNSNKSYVQNFPRIRGHFQNRGSKTHIGHRETNELARLDVQNNARNKKPGPNMCQKPMRWWDQPCHCQELPAYFSDHAHFRPSLATWPLGKEQFLVHCKQIIDCPGHSETTRNACRDVYRVEWPVLQKDRPRPQSRQPNVFHSLGNSNASGPKPRNHSFDKIEHTSAETSRPLESISNNSNRCNTEPTKLSSPTRTLVGRSQIQQHPGSLPTPVPSSSPSRLQRLPASLQDTGISDCVPDPISGLSQISTCRTSVSESSKTNVATADRSMEMSKKRKKRKIAIDSNTPSCQQKPGDNRAKKRKVQPSEWTVSTTCAPDPSTTQQPTARQTQKDQPGTSDPKVADKIGANNHSITNQRDPNHEESTADDLSAISVSCHDPSTGVHPRNGGETTGHNMFTPQRRARSVFRRHGTEPIRPPRPMSPAAAVRRATAHMSRLFHNNPVIAGEREKDASSTNHDSVNVNKATPSMIVTTKNARSRKKSAAEMQARKPKLSRYVPHHERTADQELIRIGRYTFSYDRHISAPYAFRYNGKLYAEYLYLTDKTDHDGQGWDEGLRNRLTK
ncbi:MAG: hypothetical protein Q9219_005127 [cf. Caloplaca sp. 3 TL-2023]